VYHGKGRHIQGVAWEKGRHIGRFIPRKREAYREVYTQEERNFCAKRLSS